MRSFNHSKKRILYTFLLLVLLFLLPIIGSHLLFKYGRNFLIQHQSRYGSLLEPPLNFKKMTIYDKKFKKIDLSDLKGKWLLLYIHFESDCSKHCMEHLLSMRKIQLALGKEGVRLMPWILTPFQDNKVFSVSLDLQDLGIHHGQISPLMLESFFSHPNFVQYAKESGFYIVDPNGNLIMAYSRNVDSNHILKDLKRLLRASRIG